MRSLKPSPARLKHVQQIFKRIQIQFPDATTALTHKNPFELLIATILSAQCTDKRVNLVTPALFREGPTPAAMRGLGEDRIQHFVKSINFFRNKAHNIFLTCETLVRDFNSVVPSTLDELVQLPGVGRKTANVVLGTIFGTPGMVVDTHVLRVSNRLGLVKNLVPEKVEKYLEPLLPKSQWVELAHLFILHGRKTCSARAPACARCDLVDLCPSAFKSASLWKDRLQT